MKKVFPMKKFLSILLIFCLFLPSAMAGLDDEPYHLCDSVVSNEKTDKKYDQFYASGEFSIIIPGLSMDFVPQGMAYFAQGDLVFFTGYSSWECSSMLLAVDMSTNEVYKEILLATVDGDPYLGHAGGVAVTMQNIFISDDGYIYRIPMDDFFSAAPLDVLAFAEAIPVPCKASYCQIDDGVLWVGEFYYEKDKDFHTDSTHHVNAKDGKNHSWLVGYKLDSSTDNELSAAAMTSHGAVPDYVLSTTDRIQGVTVCNGMFYLSQSYGRTKSSTILRYENVLTSMPNKYVNVFGAPRPLWILDSTTEDARLVAPPMTEGLCTIDGNVCISFESAATKYRDPEDPADGVSVNPIDRVFKLNPDAF